MRFCIILFISVLSSSCDKVGGGIAGAGRDPKWIVNEARDFRLVIDDAFFLRRISTNDLGVVQTFDKMLNWAPEHALIAQGTNQSFGEYTFSTLDRRLAVKVNGAAIISEEFPKAFTIFDFQFAHFKLCGQGLLLFLTKSRASTGLYFLAIYRESGERLLIGTFSTGEIWDCKLTSRNITFMSRWQCTTIGFKECADD
jgi:hypothetical protein